MSIVGLGRGGDVGSPDVDPARLQQLEQRVKALGLTEVSLDPLWRTYPRAVLLIEELVERLEKAQAP